MPTRADFYKLSWSGPRAGKLVGHFLDRAETVGALKGNFFDVKRLVSSSRP